MTDTTAPEPCRVCGLYPPLCRGHSTITEPGLDGGGGCGRRFDRARGGVKMGCRTKDESWLPGFLFFLSVMCVGIGIILYASSTDDKDYRVDCVTQEGTRLSWTVKGRDHWQRHGVHHIRVNGTEMVLSGSVEVTRIETPVPSTP